MPEISFPPERIEDGLGFLVNQLSYELRQAAMRRCSEVGYKATPEGLGVLFLLSQNDGLTQSSISEFLAKDKSMITRLLNALEAEGLVHREQDEKDRRVSRSYLTDTGRKAIEEFIPLFRSFFAELYVGIDAADFITARKVLSRLISNLKGISGR